MASLREGPPLLLQLPTELRMLIYEEIFSDYSDYVNFADLICADEQPLHEIPGIIYTNRAIYNDVCDYLFDTHPTVLMVSGPLRLSPVTKQTPAQVEAALETLLRILSRLQHLHLMVFLGGARNNAACIELLRFIKHHINKTGHPLKTLRIDFQVRASWYTEDTHDLGLCDVDGTTWPAVPPERVVSEAAEGIPSIQTPVIEYCNSLCKHSPRRCHYQTTATWPRLYLAVQDEDLKMLDAEPTGGAFVGRIVKLFYGPATCLRVPGVRSESRLNAAHVREVCKAWMARKLRRKEGLRLRYKVVNLA